MADNICPLCGEKLKNGYCAVCGGGMSDAYDDAVDNNIDHNRENYEQAFDRTYNNFTEEHRSEPRNSGQTVIYSDSKTGTIGSGNYKYSASLTMGNRESDKGSFRQWETTGGSDVKETRSFSNGTPENFEMPEEMRRKFEEFNREFNSGVQPRAFRNSGERTPLLKLIFSKEHRWKFILAIFLGPLTFIIAGLTTASPDPDTKKVGIAWMLFSFLMTIVMAMLVESNVF